MTGQDSTSDLIIAAWLTLLKFDHSALSPVRLTETLVGGQPRDRPGQVRRRRGPSSFASALAPAWMIAVCPSREMLTPGCGATTVLTRGSACSSAVARAITCCAAGSAAIGPAAVVHDDLQGRRAQPGEVLRDHVARLDRLAAAVLPARSGQGRLDLRRERTEHRRAPPASRRSTIRRWVAVQAPSRASQPGSAWLISTGWSGRVAVVVTLLL